MLNKIWSYLGELSKSPWFNRKSTRFVFLVGTLLVFGVFGAAIGLIYSLPVVLVPSLIVLSIDFGLVEIFG